MVLVLATLPNGCGGVGGRNYKIRADQQASISGTVKFVAKKVPVNALVTFFNPDEALLQWDSPTRVGVSRSSLLRKRRAYLQGSFR